MKKHTKTKIRVGSVVKAKVGELEKITSEGRIRRIRKKVVGCLWSVVRKKIFLLQIKDGKKKDIMYSSLVFLSSKEEVDMDEAISYSPELE